MSHGLWIIFRFNFIYMLTSTCCKFDLSQTMKYTLLFWNTERKSCFSAESRSLGRSHVNHLATPLWWAESARPDSDLIAARSSSSHRHWTLLQHGPRIFFRWVFYSFFISYKHLCVFNVIISMLESCFTLHLMLRSSMIREMAQVKMRRKLVFIINTDSVSELVSFSISFSF